jgi:hypothetical protein
VTVAEMIAHLQKLPPDMQVCVEDGDGDLWFASEVSVKTDRIESRRYFIENGCRKRKALNAVPPETVVLIT